jgi:hypothetical protein
MSPNEIIIHDGNWQQFAQDTIVDGEKKTRGLVPRNLKKVPHGSMPEAVGFALETIPQSEWSQRIADKRAAQTQLSDISRRGNFGKPIPAQDQNGKGYCWAHSTVGAIRTTRALQNLPFVELSAYSVACVVKGYRDEGGWCGESLKFLVDNGVAPASKWPLRSMSQSNNTPEMKQEAAKFKVTEGFYDLGAPIWNQKLTFEQAITCLLLNLPCAFDFNWWGHSVEGMDGVDGAAMFGYCRAESGKLYTREEHDEVWAMNDPVTAGIGVRIFNSWGDTWGDKGMGILTGNQAKPDGAVCIRLAS